MQLVDYLSRIHFFHRLKTGYYLIFKTATLKVKLPVGFPKKQMAQFWVASVPLTPRVTVYCHPIRSSDQIEMIMYSVTLICKSYACFSDFAVMVLVKNSIPGRLLFKHQHLNASPYGFAGVYRQCRCVITVCTRKSPACHKVCNFNKIYCPFFRCNINKDNVHKSIISWSRSVHEKRCIGVSIKLNIYRKCWKISNINEDLTILSESNYLTYHQYIALL